MYRFLITKGFFTFGEILELGSGGTFLLNAEFAESRELVKRAVKIHEDDIFSMKYFLLLL